MPNEPGTVFELGVQRLETLEQLDSQALAKLETIFRKKHSRSVCAATRIAFLRLSVLQKHTLSYDPYGPAHAILYNLTCELTRAGPDGLAWAGQENPVRICFNIFTLFKLKKEEDKMRATSEHNERTSFTIQKNFQMPSYSNKQLLFKTLIESQVTANLPSDETRDSNRRALCSMYETQCTIWMFSNNSWAKLAKKGKCGALSSLTNYSVACT